jgi:hypothetical protein
MLLSPTRLMRHKFSLYELLDGISEYLNVFGYPPRLIGHFRGLFIGATVVRNLQGEIAASGGKSVESRNTSNKELAGMDSIAGRCRFASRP